ncbi:TetR/AcrR family transcriptional regulator [Zavarzinia compransoris]|uniref:TetR/AcrR family transcriptional regulator n=1 Tax=Zavarzinia marina TaxID=2911065 RepID=UPI001F27B329|nr:TetR/AcrR family transcriptional regulator [Zavarzinia marina]MCF4165475.1 TetR/AcrR family transcriptional regulator [Zavarzinia marina]
MTMEDGRQAQPNGGTPAGRRAKTRTKSGETRDRIADVARDLFNEYGYLAVTTNRIARACGISPGNLYYHFRNREDILWYLFEGVENHVRQLFLTGGAARGDGLERLRRQMTEAGAILVEFRFFFPDHVAIIRREERLEEAFRSLQRGVTEAVAANLAQMTGETAAQSLALSRALWIVATGWVSFLLVQGERVDMDSIEGMVDTVIALVAPRVRPAAARA